MATFNGTNSNDTLNGGKEKDILNGLAGNDILNGGLNSDTLLGGAGDDTLLGGDGNDILRPYGGKFEQGSPVELDTLTGGNGSDLFDLRDSTGSPAYLNDDALDSNSPKGFALITDFTPDLNAGAGDKIQLQGTASEYRLVPVFWGQPFGQENTANVVDAALVFVGPKGDKQDVVAVLQDVSAQTITNSSGFLNNSNVFVFDPNYIHPQPDTDTPGGTPGVPDSINRIIGTPKADTLQGTAGTDLILGLGAKDVLAGGAGNDILVGGAGGDTLSGGAGADLFVFNRLSDKGDRIIDFNKQEGDKLAFDLDGFAGLRSGVLKANQFVKGAQARDGNDRFIYDQRSGSLFYDKDGKGGVAQVKIATFGEKPALTARDIIVAASPF
ncbi:calcium-binding protein [Oculatella sp. LEGE 06141]|uniref:calcium-binding protein n=1 Tax=Oculatella sp. LEGE 06141 TaxID=1828648 RepID=UPI00188090C5|nr:calcium-binding protein [Oculatella sp. LEGE 06141]MBE9178156.1 calcium-binding protein [Oculatella sp. LEGE 06141]